ncbi:SDR family oxidoreductase [bacterium]|nr:SDR family oxidoreductase [bacterium]MBU1074178.1 SDR family oxidoreductase [bacterium]MBU1676964.1 SDR family oxidoreductase [bacterium]
MQKALVTGGAGFIGSHLAAALVERGWDVTVLDNLSTGKLANMDTFRDRVRFVEGSIADAATVQDCCRGVDVVFHQAALASVPRSVDDPFTSNLHNIDGTLQVLLAARDAGVKRLVYAASSSAYGDSPTLPKREDMPSAPMSPYAVQKYVGELYLKVFADLYGLSSVGLRYFNVFGPRQDPTSQYAAVVPIFITKLLAGESPTVNGDGSYSRDFTYIDNVVHANMCAAEAPDPGGITVNIACGDRFTLNELYEAIQEFVGTRLEPMHGPARTGDVPHSQADIALAREVIGYTPQIDFTTGLSRTVAWYKEQSARV